MRPILLFFAPAHGGVLLLAAAAIAVPLHAVDLKVDINHRDPANNTPANTEGGFQAMAMSGTTANQSGATTATFGAQTVTITPSIPGTLTYSDRKRAVPVNNGTFTQQALLQDFIFAVYNAAEPNAGIDVEITGLIVAKEYQVTLWSYDNSSGGTRVADWLANGVLKMEDYTFDGRVLPAANETYQMNFTATADGSGRIVLQGRRDSTSVDANNVAQHGVFLNAFWIRDLIADVDTDGMADGWESAHGLVVGTNDAALDPDNDFLTNLKEYEADTDPQDNDTDNDTLLDGYEKKTGIWVSATDTGTSPLLADTDGDGLGDALENPDLPWNGPSQPGTNPNLFDTDGDTFSDFEEINWPSNPLESAEFPNPAAGATLAVDIENTTLALQPGFEAFPGPGTTEFGSLTSSYDPYTVTISAAGSTTLLSRDRAAAAGGAGFNPMFRDFIFAQNGADDGDGLDVTITGLAPNTWYPVTLWSWDPSSVSPARHSTWLASEGDVMVVKVPLYSLDNGAVPTSGRDRLMKFDARTDTGGQLIIQGRKEEGYTPTPATAVHVLLDAFVIGPPITPIRFTAIAGPQLTWASDDVGIYRVEFSSDLAQWTTLNGAVDGQAGTTSFTDTSIPPGTMRRFYRVERVSP